jgi:predicted O-methyltransferase YrrM
MNDQEIKDIPKAFVELSAKCKEVGFDQPSDRYIGSLLKTLAATKPAGNFLELGTGIGLSLSWLAEGMDEKSTLISIDNDPKLINIVTKILNNDSRLDISCVDGFQWLENYTGEPFDMIFADTWPGKYFELEKTLALVKVGGYYIIDDMNPTDDWPEGHAEKATALIDQLEARADFLITKMNWSTGIIICTRNK